MVAVAVLVAGGWPAASAWSAEKPVTGTLDADGVKIAYSIRGHGEPVVLIHGWLASAGLNWDLPGTTALLAKDFRVITLDVRGHGKSDKPTDEEAYGLELAADVIRLLDHLKIKQAHIVGYSMGGIIAGNLLANHPDRCLSGTLGGMGWLQEGGLGQRFFAQIGRNDPNAKALTICGRSLAKLAITRDQLKGIRVPVVVIVGDEDRPILRLYVDPLKSARPDWKVVEIEGANHISCILKPRFREEIAEWLKQNGQKTGR
ncbi:MAG TPA: alpha/beta hydrolase [Planctomycetaceae bacterium]|nr:alpha/beta hydrolase [Planctomycetaceae bacterium]